MSDADDLADVSRLEQLLLDPAVRSDPGRVGALLHPDFVEHGASGRSWDRDALVDALRRAPAVPGESSDVVGVKLSADVVLLTYRLTGPAASLRSSIWVRDHPAGWRLRFHQGTRASTGV